MKLEKYKLGECFDCPPGTPKQPVIANRCVKIHYKRHRNMICVAKQKNKPQKQRKPIPQFSKKRAVENAKYTAQRIVFMGKPDNQICPINGTQTTDVHHVMKRIGFADSWARIQNIPLLLDERFWLAVSREGHNWIHDNPKEAKELGYLK